MIKKTYLIILSFFATALLSNTFAQEANINSENDESEQEFKTYWYLSLDGGATTLYGDNTYEFLDKQFNARLSAGYFFNPYIGTDLRFGYGKLKGTHSINDISNTIYTELNANAVFEPINAIFGYDPDRIITVQLHLGIGQIYTNATTNNKGILFEIPMGIMAGLELAEYLYLYMDYSYSWIDSGYLDGHNTDLTRDKFTTINIGLNLKFGKLMSSSKKIRPTLYQTW